MKYALLLALPPCFLHGLLLCLRQRYASAAAASRAHLSNRHSTGTGTTICTSTSTGLDQ